MSDQEAAALTQELMIFSAETDALRERADVSTLEAASSSALCEVAVQEAEEWQLQAAEADDQVG